MDKYYDISKPPVCSAEVRMIQLRLNSIRERYHYDCDYKWEKLDLDGVYGPKTKAAVMAFQGRFGITPVSGILGPTTMRYIISANQQQPLRSTQELQSKYDLVKKGIGKSYTAASKTISLEQKVESVDQLADLFLYWNRNINESYNGLTRRLNKFPTNKQMRARNVMKQLDFSRKFFEKAQKYGITKAVADFKGITTKEKAIKYIKEIGEMISSSPLTKTVRFVSKWLGKIKNIIRPVIKVFNKIPGLKYASVIEKLVTATYKMIKCDFEGAFKLYLDALRELAEQLIIDVAVAAALAGGGWILIVLAVVAIIGFFVVDYFFFSDNPGESLADKYTPLKTTNIIIEDEKYLTIPFR